MRDSINDPAPANLQPELPRLCRFSSVVASVVSQAAAVHEARRTGQPLGPDTGFKSIDRELGGAFAPGVHMLQGNTGTGKTAWVLQLATRQRALMVTCEMSPEELLRRHAANVTSTYLGRFKSGEMPPEQVEKLILQAVAAAPDFALVDATRAYASPLYLREVAEEIRGDATHMLIVVDSLHSWVESSNIQGAGEYEMLNAGLAALRTLAHTLSCPILVISELNRAGMKDPGANSGAGTRRIEYGAETVINLIRKEDTKEDGAGEVDVTLKFSKNRHGASGRTVALKFHGALQRFREARDE